MKILSRTICLLLLFICSVSSVHAQSVLKGDVNGDDCVDVGDVTTLVNIILNKTNSPNTDTLRLVDTWPVSMQSGYVETTATTAEFSSYFQDNGKVGYGVAYSDSEDLDPLKWTRQFSNNSEYGIFSVKVGGLTPSAQYYYRFFVSTDSTIHFSGSKPFETMEFEPKTLTIKDVECRWTEAIVTTQHDSELDVVQSGVAFCSDSTEAIWQYSPSVLYFDGDHITKLNGLMPDCEYLLRPYVICVKDTLYGDVTRVRTKGFPSTNESVDLGLSVCWATHNLGAEKPEDRGLFYAWGETVGYHPGERAFSWANYSLCDGTNSRMLKYCLTPQKGEVDNQSTLLPEDDAASVALGGGWRMPTDEEFTELRNKCIWTWTSLHGVNGYVVSNNDAAIFLPVTGNHAVKFALPHGGFYWTSSLLPTSHMAWRVQFYETRITRFRDSRFYGECIRPVR